MRQLVYVKPGVLEWRELAEPHLLAATDAIVRPFIAARCDGDMVFLKGPATRVLGLAARLHVVDPLFLDARTDPFRGPFPYGHEGVAQIVSLGAEVRGLHVGQTVVVPWAVACGACPACQAKLTSHCATHPGLLGAYGFSDAIGGYGGMVCDALRVPFAQAMLVPIPDGIEPLSLASASDNLPDGYRTVAPQLAQKPGAAVLIVGGAAKSVGLYAAASAVALGSERVDYVDSSAERLAIAASLGAHPIERTGGARWYRGGKPVRPGGHPIVVDASSTEAGLRYALAAMAVGGTCTAVGFYLRRGTPLPLWSMYLKSATLHVGVSHPSAVLPDVMSLVASRKLQPEKVTQQVAAWDDAPKALLQPATKQVLVRPRLPMP